MRCKAVIIALYCFSSAACAEEMASLSDIITAGSDETYPLVRCAALYLSVLQWGRETKLGKESSDQTKLIVAHLVSLVTKMRTPTLAENAEKPALRDIASITDMYLSRYQANYTTSGQVFGLDPLWQSDSDVCQLLLGN